MGRGGAEADLGQERVAARNVAVVHQGQRPLVGVLEEAAPKGHHGAERPQTGNHAPRIEMDRGELGTPREGRIGSFVESLEAPPAQEAHEDAWHITLHFG